MTRRDKREFLNLGRERDSVTESTVGTPSRHATPDHEKALALLKAEVTIYLNTYTSRGYHAEGMALARLRKAAERGDFPAPSPGSPGSPEREAEQRIRNERAARMVKKLEELFDNQP